MSSGFASRFRPPKTAEERWRERRERRRRQLAQDAAFPVTVAQVADPDNLYACYWELRRTGGQSPGVDDVTYADLSNREAGEILRRVSAMVLDGTYRPQPTRRAAIPKAGSDKMRELRIGVICDRVVGKALHQALTPLWEGVFLDCSWGFRPARSAWKMLAALEVQMTTQDCWVLAVDDLKTAFDLVPLNEVRQCHRKLLGAVKVRGGGKNKSRAAAEKKKLLRLVMTVLRGGKRRRIRGIDQGGPYSPTALNGLLHHWLDQPITATMELPLWYRYADNLCYLAQSVSDGRHVLRTAAKFLRPLGMPLKGEDGVADLAAGETALLLGFTLKRRRKKLVYGLGKKALDQLAHHLGKAHATRHPPEVAHKALLGWMDAVGPAFEDGDAAVHMVLQLTADQGFRELATPEELREHWEQSWIRWQVVREDAWHQGG